MQFLQSFFSQFHYTSRNSFPMLLVDGTRYKFTKVPVINRTWAPLPLWWFTTRLFTLDFFFNISYSDYDAFRNPIPPNPTRRAPSLALPPHLRVPRLRVEEGEQTIHPGDCSCPALHSQGLGYNHRAQAPTHVPLLVLKHILYMAPH